MTNYEYIKSLSIKEFADFLCGINTNCDTCTKRSMCNWFLSNGFIKRLKEERKN